MLEAIKRFFRYIFSCFYSNEYGLASSETETESLLVDDTSPNTAAAINEQSPPSLPRKNSTANIQAILTEEDCQSVRIIEDESPLPLTDEERETILTAAATKDFDYNAYIESLGKRKHKEAGELIISTVKTRFAGITSDVADILSRAKTNSTPETSAELSRAYQLSDSWRSLSREILSSNSAETKSIAYRCDHLKEISTDATILKLLHSIKRCFASCKKMLAISLFSREALNAQKEQDARCKAENAANDEREARKNNPMNGIKGYKMPEDDGEDSDDAPIMHQESIFIKLAH